MLKLIDEIATALLGILFGILLGTSAIATVWVAFDVLRYLFS